VTKTVSSTSSGQTRCHRNAVSSTANALLSTTMISLSCGRHVGCCSAGAACTTMQVRIAGSRATHHVLYQASRTRDGQRGKGVQATERAQCGQGKYGLNMACACSSAAVGYRMSCQLYVHLTGVRLSTTPTESPRNVESLRSNSISTTPVLAMSSLLSVGLNLNATIVGTGAGKHSTLGDLVGMMRLATVLDRRFHVKNYV
jgi:hypothetical protein